MSAVTATVDERLEWEASQRPRAAIAAFLGALLTLGGGIYNGVALRDTPRPLGLDALDRVAQPGAIGAAESLRIPQFQFYSDNAADLLIGALLLGFGALATSGALTYLAYATRHRAERFPRFLLYLAFVGGVLVFIGSLLTAIGTTALVNQLLDGARTVDAVKGGERPASLYAGRIIQGIGSLVLAGSFILVALNAMRAGLLTRFMGALGIFAGLLVVLPIIAVAPILQPLWLLALGALFLQRWPGGVPPAWRTGTAEPWPTAAQQREARQAARSHRPAARVPDAAADEPQEPKLHPSSKKRKRKRRA